jgi:hypothetical protein
MNYKLYWKYFKYILEHKKNVFLECIDTSKELRGRYKLAILIHAFTHDLSKFSSKEFKAYAINFYGEKDCIRCSSYMECNYNQIGLGKGKFAKECSDYDYKEFNEAWKHHYKNNKHHWNYWIGQDMPYKYTIQMICDWRGMSIKFGDTAQEFYLRNYKKMDLSWRTRMDIELILNLNISEFYNYGHTLEQFAGMYDKETYNNYFGFIQDKYNVDSYELFKNII